MGKEIVLASNNSGKILELQTLLKDSGFTVTPQSQSGVKDVEETGLTFIENALLKARHACQITGLPAIADDSGLCVKALNDAPGIYSARYSGANAGGAENIKKLLHELRNVSEENRQAYFYCVLVYLEKATDPTPLVCEARWDGFILKEPRGTQGFGYDPVFYDPQERCSAAELAAVRKNVISHRGKALQMLVNKLSTK